MTTGILAAVEEQPRTGYTASLYCNVGQLIIEGLIAPPAPEYGRRSDGVGVFYKKTVNSLIGDPESGKTWIALTTGADVLFNGGSFLVIDLDHNGPEATVSRLQAMGVSSETLSDPQRFRYCQPEDAIEIAGILHDAREWLPDFVLIDSAGELLPIYGANSNSADDFTRVHSVAIKPFAALGACVVLVDHQSKGSDSRTYGATGTAAKKRAVSGTLLRVTIDEPFTPGAGGRAEITLIKDRHGGLRSHCSRDREPLVGHFKMTDWNGALDWTIKAPEEGERPTKSHKIDGASEDELLKTLDGLQPEPFSVRDVKDRCGWGTNKASAAWKLWQERAA